MWSHPHTGTGILSQLQGEGQASETRAMRMTQLGWGWGWLWGSMFWDFSPAGPAGGARLPPSSPAWGRTDKQWRSHHIIGKEKPKGRNIWADLYCSSACPPTLDWCSSAQYLSNVHLYLSVSLRLLLLLPLLLRDISTMFVLVTREQCKISAMFIFTWAHQRAVLIFKLHSVHFVLRRELPPHTVQCSKKSNLSPRYLYLSWEAI